MQGLGLKDSSKPDPPKKISSGLLVASCAAVLTVYAAGYARTQDAADRLASQIAKRRVAVSTPQQAHLSIQDSAAIRGSRYEEHGDHERPRVVDLPPSAAPPEPPREALAKVVIPDSPQALGVGVKTEAPIAEPAPAELAAPVPPPAPTITATPVSSLLAPPASLLAPSNPAPVATTAPAPVWKDGTYSGWGYSRHGNIEATVVIEGGRIASAVISQCRTRYSCSVIDRLPPQVAQRQSPDVDYVSGATQSADAFYGGVVEALGKAKLK
jgi:uncharacterized protein with FMN-binding domain